MATKTATKKALAQFTEETGYTPEKVLELFKGNIAKANEYDVEDEELALFMFKDVFRNYDAPTDEDVVADLVALVNDGKLKKFTIKAKRQAENHMKLGVLIDKIVSNVDCKASDFEEWNDDFKAWLKENYGHQNGNYYNGVWSWGKFFFYQISNYKYDRENPPFHCYGTSDGEDVYFTRSRHKWIESKGCYDFEAGGGSGCATVILALIIVSLFFTL